MNDQPPPLGESKKEIIARTTATTIKAIANAIPGAGLLLGPAIEIALNEIIPSDRLDRIEVFLRYLDQRANPEKFEEWVKTEDGAEHFEEAIRQAAKSRGEKRREYLANLVVEGMSETDVGRRRARQMLRLLEMIDDDQIIILMSNLEKYRKTSENSVCFWKMYRSILGPFNREITSSDSDIAEALHKADLEQYLVSFGLLSITRADGIRNGIRPSDAYSVTITGKEFLRYLGVSISDQETT